LWFNQIDDENHETKRMWVYVGDYWEQREKKVALLDSGANEEANELLFPPIVQGLACDFISYDPSSKVAPNGGEGPDPVIVKHKKK